MAHATNPTCASCHTHSDPIGLSLEGFDTIGQRRLTENGQLIDLSAKLQGKSFKDGAGLGQLLVESLDLGGHVLGADELENVVRDPVLRRH